MHAGDVLDLFIIVKIVGCAARSEFAGRSGAQRNEEIANREGVASGSATTILYFIIDTIFISKAEKRKLSFCIQDIGF